MEDNTGLKTSRPPEANTPGALHTSQEARCPHCGYPLYGLPQARCPECGQDFDPAQIHRGFTARWPELMMWWLAPTTLLMVWSLTSFIIRAKCNLTGTSWRIALGCLISFTQSAAQLAALVGLYRHQDWARKLLVAGCVLVAIIQLCIPLVVFLMSSPIHAPDIIFPIQQIALCAMLVLFLLTGLRPYSLRTAGAIASPQLSRDRFSPRKDWLLLLMIILLKEALWYTSIVAWLIVSYFRPPGDPFPDLSGLLTLLTMICLVIAIIIIWRRPTTVRVTPVIVLVVVLLLQLVGVASWLRSYSSTSNPSWRDITNISVTVAYRVLPLAGAVLFLFMRLSREEIRQTAYADDEDEAPRPDSSLKIETSP